MVQPPPGSSMLNTFFVTKHFSTWCRQTPERRFLPLTKSHSFYRTQVRSLWCTVATHWLADDCLLISGENSSDLYHYHWGGVKKVTSFCCLFGAFQDDIRSLVVKQKIRALTEVNIIWGWTSPLRAQVDWGNFEVKRGTSWTSKLPKCTWVELHEVIHHRLN